MYRLSRGTSDRQKFRLRVITPRPLFVPEREILEHKAQLKGRWLLSLIVLLYGAVEYRAVQAFWGTPTLGALLADAGRC